MVSACAGSARSVRCASSGDSPSTGAPTKRRGSSNSRSVRSSNPGGAMTKAHRNLLFALALGGLPAWVLPSLAHAEQKIGFVDLESALNNVEEGKKAKAVLEQ